MVIVQAYRHPYNLLVPACLSTQMDIYARIKYSLKEEMSKSVGYSVVGLAAVLLGVLIVVPFVKGFFVSQFDGYIDYSATFLTYAKGNAAMLNNYLPATPLAKLLAIQSSYQNVVTTTPITDPTYGDKQNQLMLVTLAINAKNGDANSIAVVNNTFAAAKIPVVVTPASLGVPVPAAAAAPVKTAVTVGAAPVVAGQFAVPATAAAAAPVKTAVTAGAAPVVAGQFAVPATAAAAAPVKTAVTAGAAPVGAGQVAGVAPSLSVNVAKPSSTLDLLKSACQSLIADTTVSLTGVADPRMMNTTPSVTNPVKLI